MIRIANINDLNSIVEIYNQTIPLKNVTADTSRVTVESRIEWFQQFNEKRPLWVFESDNKVIAWLSIRSFYGRPAYQKVLGAEMIFHAINECRKIGIKTILAFIFGNNQVSLNFFAKYGFIEYGNLPSVAEIENENIDLVIMGLKL